MRNSLLTASLVLALASAAARADLPKVKTAAELHALPPITLALGYDVRVAFADPGEAAGPWTLLYCQVTEGKKELPMGRPGDRVGMELGPLDVKVEWDNLREIPLTKQTDFLIGEGIYCTAVPLTRRGTCHVTLLDGDNAIARHDFVVEEVKPLYWQPLILSTGLQKQINAGDYSAAVETSAARPRYSGYSALWEPRDSLKPAEKEDLFKRGLTGETSR